MDGPPPVPRSMSDDTELRRGAAGKVPLGRSRSAAVPARPGLAGRQPSWSRVPESWVAMAAQAGPPERVPSGGSAAGSASTASLASSPSPGSSPTTLSSLDPGSAGRGSLPPAGPIAGLTPELAIALESYFAEVHPMWPIVHRASFDAALRGTSPIYRRPPLLLALALGACGARVLQHASGAYRAQASHAWAEAARKQLLAQPEDDLEAAQALTILMDVYSPAGVPGLCYALVKRAALAADRLRGLIAVESPRTVTEWLFRESVTRLRIFLVSYDLAVSVQTESPTFGNYFHRSALALPCAEAYFDDPDPAAAFAALTARWQASETRSVPVVQIGQPTIEGVVKLFQDLAAAAFGGGCSVLSLFYMANFSRHILMTTFRSDPGPSGLLRKQAVAVLSVLCESTLSVLPPKVADALGSGNPAAVLAGWEEYFPREALAHTAVQMILAKDSYAVDRLLVGGFRAAARVRCLAICGMLRGLARADRGFRWAHFMLAPPAFKVGVELAAAAAGERVGVVGETHEEQEEREARLAECEAGVRAAAACLDGLGRKFGLQIRKLADLFHVIAGGHGVRIDRRMPAAADAGDPSFREDPDAEGWAPFFWDRLFRDGLGAVLLGGVPAGPWEGLAVDAGGGWSPTPSVGSVLSPEQPVGSLWVHGA